MSLRVDPPYRPSRGGHAASPPIQSVPDSARRGAGARACGGSRRRTVHGRGKCRLLLGIRCTSSGPLPREARPATDLAGPAASSSWIRVAFLSCPDSAGANAALRDSFLASCHLTRCEARHRRELMAESTPLTAPSLWLLLHRERRREYFGVVSYLCLRWRIREGATYGGKHLRGGGA